MAALFLGGFNWRLFAGLVVMLVIGFATIILASPYRRQRLFGFMDPWSDPYGKGYQLSHSLIAFRPWRMERRRWRQRRETVLSAGSAHRLPDGGDRREMGLSASPSSCCCSFPDPAHSHIGMQATKLGRDFNALVAQGIGVWFGVQSFINMGVNMGLLPTKGLTLPLLSFGGSGIVANLIALGVLLRVDWGKPAADAGLQRMSGQTIMIMAGGTGGHVFPALALADAMKARGWNVVWLGTEAGIEARVVPQRGYKLEILDIAGMRGNGIKRWLTLPLVLLNAFRQSIG